MGYVEVDFSSVGRASTPGGRSPTAQSGDDVGWNSIDFDKVCHYRVEVTTAAVRGAGTSGRVELTFIGDKGVSKPIPLEYEPGSGPGFMRGATLPFRVVNYSDVGKVTKIEVKLIPELSQVGHGWMLEQISVTGGERSERYVFRSRKWFGQSDCGGTTGPLRQLLAASEDAEPESRSAVAEGLKNRPRVNLSVAAGAACVPHVDKMKEGTRAKIQREYGYAGEDAYFVKRVEVPSRNRASKPKPKPKPGLKDETDSYVAFGVADGVFMWRNLGIDAGMFSRRLMGVASEVFGEDHENVEFTLESDADVQKTIGSPEHLLRASFEEVTSEGIKGSTTACIATIDATRGVMRAANVGDSGFMLIRGDPGMREVAHRSPHQEHEFGRPFQLGHHDASDRPDDAMLTAFPLEPGDIVVMGSDGLWDNLSESEILSVIEAQFRGTGYQRGMGCESRAVVSGAAGAVVSAAYAASMDKRRTTPYSLAATENFDMVYSGGKKDDITAVVVNVG
jgi:protein phosphatase PTC7